MSRDGTGYHGTAVVGGNTFVLNVGTQQVTKNGSNSNVPKLPTEIFAKGGVVYAKSIDGIWYQYNGAAWVTAPNHPRDM